MSSNSDKYHKTRAEIEQEVLQINAAKINPSQFQPLYDKYYKPVFVFVFRRVGNEDMTDDITSQVFLKALINIKKFKSRGVPFSAWLYRIAFNEVNMYFRKNNSTRVISIESSKINSFCSDAGLESSADEDKLLMDSITELPEEAIQLLELRFFEDRPFAEMARLLGITENNVKVKVYRILDKLKQIILKKKK